VMDAVNHPPHNLTPAGIEAIDVLEQYGLGLHLGNAMKYLLRAGRKGDAVTDLRKAVWYIDRWMACEDAGVAQAIGVHADDFAVPRWTPDQVADAFGLGGSRRLAVLRLLKATRCPHMGDVHRLVRGARSWTACAATDAEIARFDEVGA
jgi:hypothetical protein